MRALFLPCLCLFLSVTAPAWAEGAPKPYPSCDRQPTSADVSGAKGAYEAGQASFNEADYARAILYWEDAFRRDCTAAKLLLNLARAYELSSKKDHAILALETYLERRPDAGDRPSIEKRIENLRAQVASETKSVPTEAAATTAATEPEPEPTEAAEPSEPAAAPQEAKKKNRPVWPVIMTASGAVVGGIGLGIMIDAAAKLETLNCPVDPVSGMAVCATPEEADRANAAVTQRTIGAIVTIVGTGFLAAGASAWYFSWKDRRSGASAHLLPVLAPGYGGVSFEGRF